MNAIFIFFIAFFATYFIIPKILWVVNSRDLIDKPDGRSSHVTSTPTMAGVSFFLSIILVVFFIKNVDIDQIGVNLIAGLTVIFIIGLKDDLVLSSPKAKTGGQFMAIIALISNQSFHSLYLENFLGAQSFPIYITIPIVVFIMLAIINAYNLIDGIDGLASIIGIVVFSGFATLFYLLDFQFYFLFSLGIIGVLLAYLRYNFSISKKIFMGDTGSLIVGFCIAFLTIKLLTLDLTSVNSLPFLKENKLVVILSIISIPLFDTLRVMGVRLLNNKSPFYPDRNHIHHILIDSGLKHYKASLFLAALNILLISLVILLSNIYNSYEMLVVMLIIFALLLILFYKLKRNIKRANKFKSLIKIVNFIF